MLHYGQRFAVLCAGLRPVGMHDEKPPLSLLAGTQREKKGACPGCETMYNTRWIGAVCVCCAVTLRGMGSKAEHFIAGGQAERERERRPKVDLNSSR